MAQIVEPLCSKIFAEIQKTVTDVIRAEIEIYFTGIFVGGTEEN